MLRQFTFVLLPLLILLVDARDVQVVSSEQAPVAPAYAPESFSGSGIATNRLGKLAGNWDLKGHWKQWMRRQDEATTASQALIDATGTGTLASSATQTLDNQASTAADPESTAAESSTSATKESTINASTAPSMISSTATSTGIISTVSSSTSSSLSSTDPGASCYITSTKTSTICATTGSNIDTSSCITTEMKSSTCSPGLLCTSHPNTGDTICMEQQNDVGLAGIIIASVFSGAILICACTLIAMCYRDKNEQRRQEELRRVKSLRVGERVKLMEGER